MADIFISHHHRDRQRAQIFEERLSRLGLDVWYDRKLRPMTFWRRDVKRELVSAKIVITLWSEAAVASRWVLYEAAAADEDDRLLSVWVRPCQIPAPFSEQQAVNLAAWEGDPDDDAWLDLVDRIAEKLQRAELKEFVALRQAKKDSRRTDTMRRLRHYTFRDMMALCDHVQDDVRVFDPDVLFSFDARGGIWAEMISDNLTYRIPVVIGLRVGREAPRKLELCFSHCTRIETSRWHLYVPPVLATLPATTKILLVDDYSITGESCAAFRRHMVDILGHAEDTIKTLTLITSPVAAGKGALPDIYGTLENSETVDLFYMFRR